MHFGRNFRRFPEAFNRKFSVSDDDAKIGEGNFQVSDQFSETFGRKLRVSRGKIMGFRQKNLRVFKVEFRVIGDEIRGFLVGNFAFFLRFSRSRATSLGPTACWSLIWPQRVAGPKRVARDRATCAAFVDEYE